MKYKLFIGAVLAVFLLGGIHAVSASQQPVGLQDLIQSDKSDGDCTGTETAGRCTDKCPPGTYQQGMDKETGALVCHADTPVTPPVVVDTPIETPPVTEFQGK